MNPLTEIVSTSTNRVRFGAKLIIQISSDYRPFPGANIELLSMAFNSYATTQRNKYSNLYFIYALFMYNFEILFSPTYHKIFNKSIHL